VDNSVDNLWWWVWIILSNGVAQCEKWSISTGFPQVFHKVINRGKKQQNYHIGGGGQTG